MLLREINKKWPNDLAQKSKINVSSLAKQNEYIFFPPVYIYISNDLGKSLKKTANRDFHLTSYYRCLIKNSTSKSGHFLPHLYAQKPTSVEKVGFSLRQCYSSEDVTSAWKVGAVTSNFSSPSSKGKSAWNWLFLRPSMVAQREAAAPFQFQLTLDLPRNVPIIWNNEISEEDRSTYALRRSGNLDV